MRKEIYIVRHGETDLNRKGIVQGRGVDSSLNEKGRAQALSFYNRYKSLVFDKVYVSALRRTHETMAPFADAGYTLHKRDTIDEISWGEHEGQLPNVDTKNEYASLRSAWEEGDFGVSVKGGETPLEVQARLKSFIKEIEVDTAERILVCTHGRTSRILLCTLLQQELIHMNYYEHRNTALSHFVYQNGIYNLSYFNNVDHLELN